MHELDSPGSRDRDVFFAQLRADGVQDVTVVGVAADYCVRWAVERLIACGFRVTVPADLTRGIAAKSTRWLGMNGPARPWRLCDRPDDQRYPLFQDAVAVASTPTRCGWTDA
nr:isochorismatase family protein [Sphingomonas sp. CFBP 13720]